MKLHCAEYPGMNQNLLDAYNGTLEGDEWGNCMSWLFATAHVLEHLGQCPPEWQYRHGLCFREDLSESESFEESELVFYMEDDGVTIDDLIVFGEMLNNLRDILVAEGKDY